MTRLQAVKQQAQQEQRRTYLSNGTSNSATSSSDDSTSSSSSGSSSGSLFPTLEESLAARGRPAFGVKRSFARAEALPPGLWEELKQKSLSEPWLIKIGRRGVTEKLAGALHQAWRGREVVKLRIHDDKSSRKANLPRLNEVLQELEERSGGVLINATGSAIWMYR